jgi:hypothetical protein
VGRAQSPPGFYQEPSKDPIPSPPPLKDTDVALLVFAAATGQTSLGVPELLRAVRGGTLADVEALVGGRAPCARALALLMERSGEMGGRDLIDALVEVAGWEEARARRAILVALDDGSLERIGRLTASRGP